VDRAARFGRFLNIISTVVVQPGLTPSQLANRVGVSERTLFRDLARLRRMGVDVDYHDGYQLQETLDLNGVRRTRPMSLPMIYEQQVRLLRTELPADVADAVQADVEARAAGALAALFESAMKARLEAPA
jgi:predicted DNA-binding transcriptional regulator YafY